MRRPTVGASTIVAAVAAGLSFAALAPGAEINVGDASSALVGISFSAVGAFLNSRRAVNRTIGWLFIGSAFSLGLSACAFAYAEPARSHGWTTLSDILLWCATWSWQPGFFFVLPCLMLLFPNGRVPGAPWRGVLWLCGGAVATSFLATVVHPGNLADVPGYRNPFGVPALQSAADAALLAGAFTWMIVGTVGSVAGLVVRFRRASGLERQQIKWFVFAGFGTLLLYVGGSTTYNSVGWSWGGIVAVAGVPLLPTAVAIAILRYRLYDIDVIINRTLVYAVLTAVLVTAYAGGVLVFRTILDPLTGDNDIAIAASTLGVAALFGPARRRIQAFIDRRFYRSRYDAQRILERFAARLRDEVDLETLSGEVLEVIALTMQPAFAGVWVPNRNDFRTVDRYKEKP